MRLLYPDDPLDQRQPDGLFLHELEIARARGFDVSIFSFEDFERGRFNPKPRLTPGEAIIYRGWMLNLDGYARLTRAVTELSARMVVSPGFACQDAENSRSVNIACIVSVLVNNFPNGKFCRHASHSIPSATRRCTSYGA